MEGEGETQSYGCKAGDVPYGMAHRVQPTAGSSCDFFSHWSLIAVTPPASSPDWSLTSSNFACHQQHCTLQYGSGSRAFFSFTCQRALLFMLHLTLALHPNPNNDNANATAELFCVGGGERGVVRDGDLGGVRLPPPERLRHRRHRRAAPGRRQRQLNRSQGSPQGAAGEEFDAGAGEG